MPAVAGPDSAGDACLVHEEIEFYSMTLDASFQADYAVVAPGLSRSHFTDVQFTSALVVGLSVPYGWINRVEGCTFGCNGWDGPKPTWCVLPPPTLPAAHATPPVLLPLAVPAHPYLGTDF